MKVTSGDIRRTLVGTSINDTRKPYRRNLVIDNQYHFQTKSYIDRYFINDTILSGAKNVVFYNCMFKNIAITGYIRNISFVNCIIDNMVLDHAIIGDMKFTSCIIRNIISTKSELSDTIISDVNFGYIHGSYDIAGLILNRINYYSIMINDTTIMDSRLNNIARFKGPEFKNSFLNCNIIYSHISNVNMRSSYFYKCDISRNYISEIYSDNSTSFKGEIVIPSLCPKEGSFIGYKKVKTTTGVHSIAVLEIPEDALRISCGNYKCRCSKARVLRFESLDGRELKDTVAINLYTCNRRIVYKKGEMVYPDRFDENRFNTCSNGIHFFMSRDKAVEY